MPVIDVEKDLDALTMTVIAELAAPPERVWELYADPRRLEPVEGGTRVLVVATFRDAEELQQMVRMGMAEGLKQALGQIDGLLAAA